MAKVCIPETIIENKTMYRENLISSLVSWSISIVLLLVGYYFVKKQGLTTEYWQNLIKYKYHIAIFIVLTMVVIFTVEFFWHRDSDIRMPTAKLPEHIEYIYTVGQTTGGSPIVYKHTISIKKGFFTARATYNIDGFQTLVRMHCIVKLDGEDILLLFDKWDEGVIHKNDFYESSEYLVRIDRKGKDYVISEFISPATGRMNKVKQDSSNVVSSRAYTEAQAKKIISERTEQIILALKNKDFIELSTYIHPKKGVRFSPYSYVQLKTDKFFSANLVFKTDKISNALADKKKYTWGVYDGSGIPINLTFVEYYKKFIYDKDFVNAKEVGYNRIIGKGNSYPEDIFKSYPSAIIVEYYFPPTDPKFGGMDWKSLRLVFEQDNSTWYIVGVVHYDWPI